MSTLTEKALAASLKELLRHKTLDKITVKDLTDHCGVNRQTFYYHFHDIYDLVEWIFTEMAKGYLKEDIAQDTWKEYLKKLIAELTENGNFIKNIFFSVNRMQLEKFVQDLSKPAVASLSLDIIRVNDFKLDEKDLEFIIEIFTFGLVGFLTDWVSKGMRQDDLSRLDNFLFILDGTMSGALEKFNKI